MTSEKSGRKDKNQNIQVFVRLRPLNQRERDIKSIGVVEVVNHREVVVRQSQQTTHTKKFTFDRAFGPHAKQLEIYQDVVSPLIEEVLCGYNCTVFAYGQTGTGKTHTMVGEHTGEGTNWQNDPLAGIIPRALSQLFDELRLSNTDYTVRVSYLELYNEELVDLLSTGENSKLKIYDDATRKGSNIIYGLEEITVYNKNEVYKIMAQGQERKRVASTLMNAQSRPDPSRTSVSTPSTSISIEPTIRSHTVFTIVVHMKENSPEGEELVKIGKLNLVDLAGSENISKAGSDNPAKRERARECVNINQSLLTLGRVITALVERHPHIPYRESKLTRLLQESLGGRTKTSIIATISPGHKDLEETMSTLEYAHRAKNIQNKPEINQKLTKKAILKEYTEEIDRLKRDLQAARDKNGVYLANETYAEMTLEKEEQRKEIQELLLHKRAMEEKRDQMSGLFDEISRQLDEERRKRERAAAQLRDTQVRLRNTSNVLQEARSQCEEQRHLVEKRADTEAQLAAQARSLLNAADIAASHAASLHNTVDRRRTVETTNLQLTQRYRSLSAKHRARLTRTLDSDVTQLVSALGGVGESLDSHSAESIQCHQHNKQTIQQLTLKLEEAITEIKTLTASTHASISAQSERQRARIAATLQARTEKARELLCALVAAVAESARRAREQDNTARASVEQFVANWLCSNNGLLSSLRRTHVGLVEWWRESLKARVHTARRRLDARGVDTARRSAALHACQQEIEAERVQLESRLARQQRDMEAERHDNDTRLQRWMEEERRYFEEQRRCFEERLARHVAEQNAALEERLTKKAAELEEEKQILEASIAKRLAWYQEQTRSFEEDLQSEELVLKDQEMVVDQEAKKVDDISLQLDDGANQIDSSAEAVTSGVLEALNQAHATLLRALEDASCHIESDVNSLIEEDKRNNVECRAESDAALDDVARSANMAVEAVVASVQSMGESALASLASVSSTTDRLIAATEQHRSVATAQASAAAAAATQMHAQVADCVHKLADLEEQHLAKEYAVYTPSGETPVRQQYQYPRQLAATSPHERILARFRSAHAHRDDDCIVVEESNPQPASDSECSEDSVVFAAPSPPAPRASRPAARGSGGLLVKSTSETDIYTIRKQQGKENSDHSITISSLKKLSKLPAPLPNKKPLAERNAAS